MMPAIEIGVNIMTQTLDKPSEVCYTDSEHKEFWLAVRELLLSALRLVEDYKLDMPHSRPTKREQGRRGPE